MGRNTGRERVFRIRKEAGCKEFQRMVKARKQLLDLVTRAYFHCGVRCAPNHARSRHWNLHSKTLGMTQVMGVKQKCCASSNGARGLTAVSVCQLPCSRWKQLIRRKRQAGESLSNSRVQLWAIPWTV